MEPLIDNNYTNVTMDNIRNDINLKEDDDIIEKMNKIRENDIDLPNRQKEIKKFLYFIRI